MIMNNGLQHVLIIPSMRRDLYFIMLRSGYSEENSVKFGTTLPADQYAAAQRELV